MGASHRIRRWVLSYDIYSPRLHRFLEIDERQHFSEVRLERIQGARSSSREANYPPYFWERVLARLQANPARDHVPPHRDEQRAYLDLVRELVPPAYGCKPTIRIDEYSLRKYRAIKAEFAEFLGLDSETFEGFHG